MLEVGEERKREREREREFVAIKMKHIIRNDQINTSYLTMATIMILLSRYYFGQKYLIIWNGNG